ncbi:hypothetical protein LTR15_012518 [Elasticomyces elasticus]|nr:hypothetical protein LTR15_012518 [Elasticomyces elasticus]
MSTTTIPIYTGLWIDFSHGYLNGATLTLSARDGAFLVSVLTLYTAVAGVQFWKLVAYTYHQTRANSAEGDQDGLWHQEQAILRNTGSPNAAAFELLFGVLAWRNVGRRRAIVGIALAICTTMIATAAGVFAGQVTSAASTNVLIDSAGCGSWTTSDPLSVASNQAWSSLILQSTLAISQYARACYSNSRTSLTCGVYTNQTIDYFVNPNATCPFASGFCLYSDSAAYEMNTGLIDSNDALGLNGPDDERIRYRKVTTCAPIHGHYSNDTIPTAGGEYQDPVIYLNMGPMLAGQEKVSNYTYVYNIHSLVDTYGYQLSSFVASPMASDGWMPTPELNRTDADVTLLVLAQNSVNYPTPSDDPWFSAHIERKISLLDREEVYYVGDYYFNNVACTDQYQFCNPNLEHGCTPLTDGTSVIDELAYIGLSDVQLATVTRIGMGLRFDNIYYSVNGRGASALRASETCSDNQQLTLQKNQWQVEVDSMFATTLARLQQSMVDYAVGPTDLPPGIKAVYPSTYADKAMCRQQKIKTTTGFQNFSFLGTAIIIFGGTILIALGLTLDTIVSFIQKRRWPNNPGYLAWILDEKRQLQRMAFEGAGWKEWQKCDDSIPVMIEGQRLGRYKAPLATHPEIQRR